MPQYEDECTRCQLIEIDIRHHTKKHFAPVDDVGKIKVCPRCKGNTWRVRQFSMISDHALTIGRMNMHTFPHVSHASEQKIQWTENGPVPVRERVTFESYDHQKKWMKENDMVFYDDTIKDSREAPKKSSEEILGIEDHPSVRKYRDEHPDGLPSKILTDAQLNEEFKT